MDRERRKINAEALVELLQTVGLDFRAASNSYELTCPLCGESKWNIRKSDGFSKCYKCDQDFRGFADYTLSVVLHRPKAELTKLLYGVGYSTLVTEERGEERWVDHWEEMSSTDIETTALQTWPAEMLPSPDHHDLHTAIGAPGLAYLNGRGVSLELAQEYGVKYDPVQERVIFPIVIEGVLRGWQGRLIKPVEYVDSKGRDRKRPKALTEGEVGGKVLIFQDRLKGSTHGIITEGPFDAIKIHLAGGNTATMGKSVTTTQLDIYVRHFGLRKLYIGLDLNAAEDVERIVRDLGWYKDIQLFRLTPAPGRGDLGDGTLEENLEQFRSAKPIVLGQRFSYLQSDRYW
jgi:predicted RNA-binding Zn-ribbon protein involved in translation (DUF1610 family)